jgi:S-DNA-T family DNA segregation ATPase FtsK/SpoIIIE
VTAEGNHFMVALPELDQPAGRVAAEDVAEVVSKVAGSDRAAEVLRLPERVDLREVLARTAPELPHTMVPFGLSESTLQPICVDFAEHPHLAAVGQGQSGRTNFLRSLCRSIMARYTPEQAAIAVFDPRRKLLGVVPSDRRIVYAYSNTDIAEAVKLLVQKLAGRMPPPGTDPEAMLANKFWTGPEIFVVVDDISSWTTMNNPLLGLSEYIDLGSEIGLHVIATADIRSWTQHASGLTPLGRIVGGLAPVLILDGRRQHGVIAHDVHAEPQRPGKGILATASRREGMLVAWSDPPQAGGRTS